MPPAALMSSMASCPAFLMALPGSAYGPEKGPVIPTLIGEVGLLLVDVPHAASNSAPHEARLTIRNRRLIIGCPPPTGTFPSLAADHAMPLRPQALPAALFPARRGESAPTADDLLHRQARPVSAPFLSLSTILFQSKGQRTKKLTVPARPRYVTLAPFGMRIASPARATAFPPSLTTVSSPVWTKSTSSYVSVQSANSASSANRM